MAGVSLRVRLTPRSGRNEIVRWENGVLHARVSSPPVDGAANASLIEMLVNRLNLRKSDIAIASGGSSREKRLEICGLSAEDLERRIETALK